MYDSSFVSNCDSRLSRRNRRLILLTSQPIAGRITAITSVSRQLRMNRYPSRNTTVSESRTSVTTTLWSTLRIWFTSNTMALMIVLAVSRWKKPALVWIIRSNIFRRSSSRILLVT